MKSYVHIEIEGVEAHHKAIRFEAFKEAGSLASTKLESLMQQSLGHPSCATRRIFRI